MCKGEIFLFGIFVIACIFTGCAVSSSGNMVGEAAAVKYSTDKKYRIAEVGMTFAAAGEERSISSLHSDVEISGGSLNLRADLISLNYSLLGQKGGLFLSVPMTIPLDIGIRPSFVQWIGLFYLGIGVSFVGGFYLNQQDDEELNADDSFGRFDGFILYNFGGGTMFDIWEKIALGAYANYERMALNSGGSTVRNSEFVDMNIIGEDYGKENLPAYAKRVDVMTLGLNAFVRMKNPLGFYVEYSPGKLMYNDGWWKFRVGAILLY